MELRAQAEKRRLEATEIGKALCQKMEKCKVRSKSQKDEARSTGMTVTPDGNEDLPTEIRSVL